MKSSSEFNYVIFRTTIRVDGKEPPAPVKLRPPPAGLGCPAGVLACIFAVREPTPTSSGLKLRTDFLSYLEYIHRLGFSGLARYTIREKRTVLDAIYEEREAGPNSSRWL